MENKRHLVASSFSDSQEM